MKNIVIGTAGHIDHGKTSLIKALTGRDTDTLAEEKKRGISINLGFTYFDLPGNKRVGIVDVPGHEKFIKNMLAGASSIDLVLFVIAADEGIMPQTIEHLDILSLLGLKKGIIVITKCNKVDEEFIELVKEDINNKIKGTFLENADVVQVDSITNQGIDNLVKKIDELSTDIDENNIESSPRLNIDRIFSVNGFGTVITGTLLEGTINKDDDLTIYPRSINTKIRSIQVHGKNVDKACAGQRTAINISNVKVEDIKRGDVLAKKDSIEETMMIDAKINVVGHSNFTVKHWDRLKLYHGSREILSRIVPLDKEIVKSGEYAYVQLRLEESIAAKKGDRFVLRSYSPMNTIGGGVIIDIASKKHKRFDIDTINNIKIKENGGLKDILEQFIKSNVNNYITIKELIKYSCVSENSINIELSKLINENKLIKLNDIFIDINKYDNLKDKSINILREFHKKNRLKEGMLKEEFKSRLEPKFKTKELDTLLENLYEDKIIKLKDNKVSIFNFNITLNEKQLDIRNNINKRLNECKTSTILTINDICEGNSYYIEVLEFMIGKDIEKIDDSYIISKKIYEGLKENLISYLKKYKEISLGEYRDLISSNRKFCLMILEDFDRKKITRRNDNKRILF